MQPVALCRVQASSARAGGCLDRSCCVTGHGRYPQGKCYLPSTAGGRVASWYTSPLTTLKSLCIRGRREACKAVSYSSEHSAGQAAGHRDPCTLRARRPQARAACRRSSAHMNAMQPIGLITCCCGIISHHAKGQNAGGTCKSRWVLDFSGCLLQGHLKAFQCLCLQRLLWQRRRSLSEPLCRVSAEHSTKREARGQLLVCPVQHTCQSTAMVF